MSDTVEERLAATIRAYWRARSHDVRTRLVPFIVGKTRGGEVTVSCARSDLVNGLPRGWVKEPKAEVAANRKVAGGVFPVATTSVSTKPAKRRHTLAKGDQQDA